MGIPTGVGTEVLNNIPKNGLNNAWWSGSDVTVPSDHIWTVLSIIICSLSSSTSHIGLRMIPGSAPDSGQTIDLIANTGDTVVERYHTFVWSDKLVLSEGDEIRVYTNQTADILISYIDQHY